MKIIESENAAEIIRLIVPEEILKLKPIIAGGFSVSLYHSVIRYENSQEYRQDLSKRIEQAKSQKSYQLVLDFIHKQNKKFDDIDCWFHKSNPIWDQEKPHSARCLIESYLPKPPNPKQKSFAWKYALRSTEVEFEIAPESDKILRSFKITPMITKSSFWANSFRLQDNQLKIQFIRRWFETTADLFSNFDILNCCAAFYDGKFYFQDEFESLFASYALGTNPKLETATTLKRIWTASRIFKYAQRYLLEPDERTCQILFNTYSEAVDLHKETINASADKIIELDTKEDPYGRKEIRSDELKFMLDQLFNCFKVFVGFKNYDPNYGLYLVGSSIPQINNVLMEKFDRK